MVVGLISIPMFLAAQVTASAADFNTLDAHQSTVGFVFKQMNVPVEGTFTRMSGTIDFDPKKPAQAKAAIDIEPASVDAGSEEANDALADKLWFDTRTYPTAHFVTRAITPLGGARYKVTGDMTIKGKTHPVEAIALFHPAGNLGVFDGTFSIKRADYGVGEGMWADFGIVANDVQIKFRLVTRSGAGQK